MDTVPAEISYQFMIMARSDEHEEIWTKKKK